ncbi:MAG: tetratricopeptide repeat protein [Anaerolineae bacterium]|nr:tetratricopeptide repeat protein [Anaerolineae bacterium]
MERSQELKQAIATLEAQRAVLGDAAVDVAIAALREKLAALDTQRAADQRKQVTVLFADIVGFTTMAEHMDPEEVHGIVSALWQQMDKVIVDHGGAVDKHIGDAVMALFGAPIAHEDDPERAIRAALAMQAEMAQSGKLQMRIGIHTGPVLLGAVGTTAEYTALGDTVNLVSRLQGLAPAGGVLISHETYAHVRGLFGVQPLEPLRVKGRSDAIQAYVVQDVRPRAFRLLSRGVEGVETRMVGREAELRQLQAAFYDVVQRRGMRALTVVGDAGLGKSRLLYEFRSWLNLQPEEVWVFRGRATQEMQRRPYGLVRDLFAFRFEIQESDAAEVARQKLEQGFRRFVGAGWEEGAHFVGHLLGFDFSASPHLRGILDEARQIHDRALHELVRFFAAATRERGAAVYLEDVHWADEGSLEVIEHLGRECREMALLLLALARPVLYERREDWGSGWAQHRRVELAPLGKEESRALVVEILQHAREVPEQLLTMVAVRAEGNPYYIEELVKALIEDGVIEKGAEWAVRVERLAAARVPATLRGLLQARVDRLGPFERETLQRASVVGRQFWDGAVAALGGVERAEVRGALRRLGERDLVVRRESTSFAGEEEWSFRSGMVHEVTYEGVLKRLRRVHHAQVAEWLVERGGRGAEGYAGLIGEHYERAGETAAAGEWYGRAAHYAQNTFAPTTAVDYYRRALAHTAEDRHAPRAVYYQGLGDVLLWRAQFAAAEAAYRAMLAAAEAAGDGPLQSRAWNRLAWVQNQQGDHHTVLESAAQAEAVARAAGAPACDELARALYWRGWTLLELGDAAGALSLGEESLALSTDLDARRDMARGFLLIGIAREMLGRYDLAVQNKERALVLFRQAGDRRREGSMLNNLGETYRASGNYDMAATLYWEALSIAVEIGNRAGEILYRSNLGGVRVGQGAYSEAEADLRAVIEMTASTGWGVLSETYRFLAEALLGQGRLEQALDAARQALALAREAGQQEFIGAAWRALGMVAAQWPEPLPVEGERYDAAACFDRSQQVFAALEAGGERARTLREWAQFELEGGDRRKGQAMWQAAKEIFACLEMELEVERMGEVPPDRRDDGEMRSA